LVASANGNVLRGGFQAFANGGVVNSPTLGLVGEGAFNEAIVPLPDGRAIPVDLGDSLRGLDNIGSSSNSATVDNSTTVNIGSVNFKSGGGGGSKKDRFNRSSRQTFDDFSRMLKGL
jgi:hypothetical protein